MSVKTEYIHFIPQYGDARVHTSTRCACNRPAVLVAKYSREPKDVTCPLCQTWMTHAHRTMVFYGDEGVMLLCEERTLLGRRYKTYTFTVDFHGWWTVMAASAEPLYFEGDPRQIL